MSAKGILIAFVIVSLLLIGMMFLVVDVRNNPIQDQQRSTNTTQQDKKREKVIQDSLKSKVASATLKDVTSLITTLNATAEQALSVIKELEERLFPGGLAAHDLKISDRVSENNAVFFKENGEYSELSKRFVGALNAFENTIRSLQTTNPAFANIKSEVRNKSSVNNDWLDDNFKDFPAVASYSRLKLLADAIRTKKDEINAAFSTNK